MTARNNDHEQKRSSVERDTPDWSSILDTLSTYSLVAATPKDVLSDIINSEELPQDKRESVLAALNLDNMVHNADDIAEVLFEATKQAAAIPGYHNFDALMGAEKLIENVAGWSCGSHDDRITPELAETRTNAVLGVVRKITDIRANETDPNKPKTSKIALAFSDLFLSASPNLADGVLTHENNFDLLRAFSSIPELRSSYIAKLHGVSYELAFTNGLDVVVDRLLRGKPTLEQLRTLRILGDITNVMQYGAGYDNAEGGAIEIADGLQECLDNGMMYSWMPNVAAQSIVNKIDYDTEDWSSFNGSAREFSVGGRYCSVHKRFDGDWAKMTPVLLAPGIIGARSEYGLIEGAAEADADLSAEGTIPNCKSLKEMLNQSGITASDDEIALFQELQNPSIKSTLESQLGGGILLEHLDLPTQFRVVNYLGTRSTNDFGSMASALVKMHDKPEHKKAFLEAFLATEFGDDFGGTLLTVAEKLPPEQLGALLEKVQTIREYGAKFAKEFAGFDGKIENSIRVAIGERITETLYVAKELATHQENIASARVLGGRITVKDMSEVMDALDLVALALRRKSEAEESGITATAYDEDNRTAWHLGTESDVLVQIKPRGGRRGEYKKGLEYSEEAQINYSIDVISRDGDYVPTRIADYRRRYALSIRLDLEGILRDDNGGKVGFDATHEQLAAALDIGSLRGAADNPNVRVARIISLGNKLRKRELGGGKSRGYHIGLPQEYGRKVKFAGLAEFMIAKYRHHSLGRGAVASVLGPLRHQSSVSQSGKVAA